MPSCPTWQAKRDRVACALPITRQPHTQPHTHPYTHTYYVYTHTNERVELDVHTINHSRGTSHTMSSRAPGAGKSDDNDESRRGWSRPPPGFEDMHEPSAARAELLTPAAMAVRARGAAAMSPVAAPAVTPGGGGPAPAELVILWDYENVTPCADYLTAMRQLVALHKWLVTEHGSTTPGQRRTQRFYHSPKSAPSAKLQALLGRLGWDACNSLSDKKEAADKKIKDEFAAVCARLADTEPRVGEERARIVLITGDSDFTTEISKATSAGAAVHVLRHRLQDREQPWLQHFARSVTYWEDVVGEEGARSPRGEQQQRRSSWQHRPTGRSQSHPRTHGAVHAGAGAGAGAGASPRRPRSFDGAAGRAARVPASQVPCWHGSRCERWAEGTCKFAHAAPLPRRTSQRAPRPQSTRWTRSASPPGAAPVSVVGGPRRGRRPASEVPCRHGARCWRHAQGTCMFAHDSTPSPQSRRRLPLSPARVPSSSGARPPLAPVPPLVLSAQWQRVRTTQRPLRHSHSRPHMSG